VALHLIKLCVGVDHVEQLAAHQRQRLAAGQRLYHRTRHMPRRAAEILDGGSLYWVIRGVVRVRQRILALEPAVNADGRTCCDIVLDGEFVRVLGGPHRPFQGWRYLADEKAPPDQVGHGGGDGGAAPPPEMAAELRELGLL